MTKQFRFSGLFATLRCGIIFLMCLPAFAATTLSVSPASPVVGSVITFTATVGATHGLVNFCNASAAICDDGALLGSVWVTTGGTAIVKRSLPPGTTNVVAVYQGVKSSVIPVTVSGIEPDTTMKEFSTGQADTGSTVLISGDFNNDGHTDILFYPKGGTPALYLGNGDGTFTTGPVPTFLNNTAWSGYENNSQNWVMGDFNRDGNLDFVGGNPPQVFLGNGSGGFTAGQKLSVLNVALLTSPTILLDDYNADGYPDLAILRGLNPNDSDACKVQIFFGKGDGTFTTGPATVIGQAQLTGDGVHCTDWVAAPHYDSTQSAIGGYPGLDGYGAFAVMMGDAGSGSILSDVYHVFINSSGIPTSYSNSNFALPPGTTWGDFTGTGEVPIDAGNSTLPQPPGCGNPQVGDFNDDGHTDLACQSNYAFYGFDLQAEPGSGNNTLGTDHTFTADHPEGPYGLTTGDFFSTGSPSVALASGSPTAYVTIVAPLKITPAVTVTCSPNPTTFGNTATTCTAQVPAGATGLMTITYDGGTAWGSGNVSASGAFSVSGWGGSPAGSHTINATYSGDSLYNNASGSTTYTIQQAVPTITWPTPASIIFGTPLSAVQLNATDIVPGTFAYNPPAGTVLPVGSQPLSVTFTPTDFVDYTSPTTSVDLTVNKGNTVTQITNSTPNPSTYGSSVTFTALVNGDGATPSPSGSVSFFDGATNLGSASVTPTASTTNLAPYSQSLTTAPWGPYCGVATNETPNAVAAPDGTVTATKFVMPSSFTCGSGVSFGAFDSIAGGLQAGTVYTASVWLRGNVGGESVGFGLDDGYMHSVTLTTSWQRYSFTFSAYVTDGEQTRGFQVLSNTPNSTYYVWGSQTEARASMGPYVATYGAGSTSGVGAVATFSTTQMPAGAQSITAVYNGDSSWVASTSGALTQNVTPAVLTLTANNASKTYGTANPAFTPSYSGFQNGDTSAVLSGSPSLTTTATIASPVGTYPINAAVGTLSAANYTFSFVNGTLTITKVTLVPNVSFTFTSSLNPSTYGTSVTFTATIPAAATGTMQFYENGVAMGTPVAVSGGVATCTTSALAVGTQAITAQYSGDTNYSAATSPTVNQVVTKAVLTITANNTSRAYGLANPVFTVSYSGFQNGDTSAVLSGSPSLTTTATAGSPVGSYPITAAIGTVSAANYFFSFVNGTLTVTKATSVLSVTSTLNPSVYGNSVTFVLTVGGSGSGLVPTGTVTLTLGGTTLLPVTTINGSGQAMYTTSTLPAGADTLTLHYSGDTNYF
jgi:MBG domain (YGX type)/Bacterial Ig-like domain (group 3)/FG-GAP-like repeat